MYKKEINLHSLKPAIFLDRDGTLIHDCGYLRNTDEVHFYDYTVPSLKMLQNHFLLFIVTNQSGISQGIQTEKEVQKVNDFVVKQLKNHGIHIHALYSCPHQREDNCSCIKPNPTFAMQAASEFNICLKRSFSIGDHPHDVEFGRQFGGTGLYLLTGHGKKHRNELVGYKEIFENLATATDRILTETQPTHLTHIHNEELT